MSVGIARVIARADDLARAHEDGRVTPGWHADAEAARDAVRDAAYRLAMRTLVDGGMGATRGRVLALANAAHVRLASALDAHMART